MEIHVMYDECFLIAKVDRIIL